MIIKCPSDCEHPYLFQHSIVTTVRIEKAADGTRTRIVAELLLCRECDHWTDSRPICFCPFKCHEETGMWVTRETLAMV